MKSEASSRNTGPNLDVKGCDFKAKQKVRHRKDAISASSSFLSGLPCFAETSDGQCVSISQLRKDLLACKEAFDLLPARSRYARSRKQVIDMHLHCLDQFDEEDPIQHNLCAWMEKLQV